jgi:hypothetical protein
MVTPSRRVTELTTANLMIGGVALLGWMAMVPLALFNQIPNLPGLLRNLDDVAFMAVLLCGPGCFVAGLGLWHYRPWGRWLALGLAVVTGVLAVAGAVLVCVGFLRVAAAVQLTQLAFFAAYSVATFVILWKNPFTDGPRSPPARS